MSYSHLEIVTSESTGTRMFSCTGTESITQEACMDLERVTRVNLRTIYDIHMLAYTPKLGMSRF